MEFDLQQASELLSRTPATLSALLSGLPEGWTAIDEGPETWSPYDVLGHLIHCERTDWIPRARIILEQGEARTFDPVDRFSMFEESKGKTLNNLLAELARLRVRNLGTLRGLALTSEQLALTGRHPDFGVVTLAQLLATWVVHDLGHIAQITRVMAKRYAGDVGPWQAYLPILAPRPG